MCGHVVAIVMQKKPVVEPELRFVAVGARHVTMIAPMEGIARLLAVGQPLDQSLAPFVFTFATLDDRPCEDIDVSVVECIDFPEGQSVGGRIPSTLSFYVEPVLESP